MNYPSGTRRPTNNTRKLNTKNKINNYRNRGMSLEDDINETNEFYLATNRAIIYKKPTPIQVVNVNYPKRSAAVITEGYFKKRATTDYNGIYKQKYIDFEAKETKNKTRFPLTNIHEHQMNHAKAILEHGGISFFIIRFTYYEETFLIPTENIATYWNQSLTGGKKSISYHNIKSKGYLIPFKYQPRLDYLTILDKLYF